MAAARRAENFAMALDKTRLREHIVFIEETDRCRLRVDAQTYQQCARELVRVVRSELSNLPMVAFVGGTLKALETTAQNVFFDGHRRFADLDGSGDALRAQVIADLVLERVRRV